MHPLRVLAQLFSSTRTPTAYGFPFGDFSFFFHLRELSSAIVGCEACQCLGRTLHQPNRPKRFATTSPAPPISTPLYPGTRNGTRNSTHNNAPLSSAKGVLKSVCAVQAYPPSCPANNKVLKKSGPDRSVDWHAVRYLINQLT